LMCRALAYSDIEIELLNYDEEVLSKSIPVKQYSGKIVDFQKLTHDIRGVQIELDAPLKFWAGQYVDSTVKTEKGEEITRSFSMANPPSEAQKLGFIIKNIPMEDSQTSSTTAASKPVLKSKSKGPTGCASDEKDEKDP
jgi:propane monooxygenase reductase component